MAQGRQLGFELAAALVLGRELDQSTQNELSQHYANVMNASFTLPVSTGSDFKATADWDVEC